MPANVETMAYVLNDQTVNGRNVRHVPWHGLGTPLPEVATAEEIATAAGINWTVSLNPTYYQDPTTGLYVQVPKNKAVVRDTDQKVLGAVGNWYAAFQNTDMLDYGDALVETIGAKWDTAGSLKDGALVFASMRLDDVAEFMNLDLKVIGIEEAEAHGLYLLLSNTHDGSRAFKAAVTPIRTVCTNTEQWALESAKATFSIRHVGDLNSRIEAGQQALGFVSSYLTAYDEMAESMLETAKTIEEVDAFIEALIPLPEKKGIDQAEEMRSDLRNNILASPTVPAAHRLTSWGLLQATSEWAEFDKAQRSDKRTNPAEKRMLSTMFDGPVAKVRTKALSLLG